jgi:hypothetical protein
MLTEGLGSVVPVAVAGTLAASALWVWFCVTLPSARGVRLASYALAGAAPVFALLTGFSRAGFGVATAGSSRYVFLITAITLPVIALALTAIARRWKLGRATALVVIGVVLLYNLALVGMWVNTRAATAEATYDRIRAAAALAAEFPGRFDESLQIYPTWAPDLELADAIWFVNEGWISRGNPSPEARLSVLASLGTTASLVDTEAGTDCVTMSPTSPSVSTEGASVVVIPNSQANITIALRDGEHLGDARQFAVGGPTLIEQDFGATIDVVSTDGEVLVCAP